MVRAPPQPLAPGPCVWISEVSPDAMTRVWIRRSVRPSWLFYRQTRISRFDVSTSQGYGTSWWMLPPQGSARGDRL